VQAIADAEFQARVEALREQKRVEGIPAELTWPDLTQISGAFRRA
jgi:hypothetical protein